MHKLARAEEWRRGANGRCRATVALEEENPLLTFRWMLASAALLTLASAVVSRSGAAQSARESPTAWAYPMNQPMSGNQPPPEANARLTIPGAATTFTPSEVRNIFKVADWRPGDHPPMPAIVAGGRRPDVMACGFCHLPTGNGRPENAPLAGLPRDYIVAQMRAFRSGARRSSVPGRVPTDLMSRSSKAISDAEINAAADYFASLTRRSFTKVTEAARVPKTRTTGWLYSRDPAGGSEPIGARIIEMPVDFEGFEHRDPTMRYIAYVPPGSIRRGRALARTWDGGQYACAACHGAGLRGSGDVPPLAGLAPTYIVRQLNDFRTGARGGEAAAPMQPVVASMTNDDMIALAAFLAAQAP